ncbi:DUF4105 domain-containing protein [bacterium]|nr:DUF4105 domain-containing protein [bacterium]MBU1989836.1 DUF4105 domain-containing protein [bacterium]
MNLHQERYWQLLLHMVDGTSEIDDSSFFLAKDGKTDADSELQATLDSFFQAGTHDDNSTLCRFPARKAWLQEKLNIIDFPHAGCDEYDKILKRLNPKSATLVFPSAHINSPASMFGHTFLRINSAYESRLLSYAINYAADANPDDTNAVLFAVKGLFGGYFGKYSLLPYYDKLKEYRDTEQRDIWEYDLDLSEEETLKMVRHIWELNGTHSYYYFFTENCSYNMLWLIELARPDIHLREHFNFEVIPLETAHIVKQEGIISQNNYRPSKRSILLKYEELIEDAYLHMPRSLIENKIPLQDITQNIDIPLQQKRYILEASIEYLEYSFSKSQMQKEEYLKMFHNISKQRAALGLGEKLHISTPQNPINSHRAVRATLGAGFKENNKAAYLGIRPAYHSLQDSSYGFLRGTQIEFLNLLLSYSDKKVEVEDATILSIVSLAQRSEFFDSFSWRTKFGWDQKYIDYGTDFIGSVGFGYSWGNKLGYLYFMADPLFYIAKNPRFGIGASAGLCIDSYEFLSTNIEATNRFYDNGTKQLLVQASQSFRLSQNLQVTFEYEYTDKLQDLKKEKETRSKASLNYYF